jgi:hypothetical protein
VGGRTIGDKCLRRRAADLKKKELAEDFLLQLRSLLLPFSKRVHTHPHAHEKAALLNEFFFFFQNLKKQIDFFVFLKKERKSDRK